MAKEDFDFKKFSGRTFNNYKNVTLKDKELDRAKYGLALTSITIGSKKKIGALIPFLKEAEAKAAYEIWMNMKPDKLKIGTCKAAIVKLSTTKGDKGLDVTLEITKGVKNPAKIETALQPLFTILKKKLTVIGGSEEGTSESSVGVSTAPETEGTSSEASVGSSTAPETSETSSETSVGSSTAPETSETSTDDKDTKKEDRQAKRAAKRAKMRDGVAKLDSVKDKASKDKMEANIQKYETALAALITEAEADDKIDAKEQKEIDELTNALNELKAEVAKRDKAPKKLTLERREKMNENMNKINERLEAITKKLGL
jgi:hypothetical protein